MSNHDSEPRPSAREGRLRRARIRARHALSAENGVHLPTVKELLLGSKFLSSDIRIDAARFAELHVGRINTVNTAGYGIHAALEALKSAPDLEVIEGVAATIRLAGDIDVGIDAEVVLDRLDFYAANFGSSSACVRVAQVALALAHCDDAETDEAAALTEAALGWLSAARSAKPFSLRGRNVMSRWDEVRLSAARDGDCLVKRLIHYNDLLAEDAQALRSGGGAVEPKAAPRVARKLLRDDVRPLDCDRDLAEILERAQAAEAPGPGVIVIPEIGSPSTHEGKKIVEAYKPVLGVRLPLPPLPDLTAVRSKLAAEFTHAGRVIDTVLRDLDGRDHVRIRPTVFVGAPGCGKTTFAVRLLAELGIGHQIYSCGGVSDSSMAGTPRQWSSGGPALSVSLVARYRTAAPGIILDEISRAGTGTQNGRLTDSLLAQIEPVSACRYLDPYLISECDLSSVIWLATCNDLDSLPAALKDRFRIITFPSPGPEHMPALANALLRRATEDMGLSAAWAQSLDGVELEALAQTWNGGSLRGLRKLVEGVLNARDQISVRM